MNPASILAAVASFLLCFTPHLARAAESVRLQGIPPLTRIVKAAAAPLRDLGLPIKVEEECGTAQAIAALGREEIDLALLSRLMTAEERAAFPAKDFEEHQIGTQTMALLVSRAVWESGVRALKREQVLQAYEGKVDSWQQFGGEKRSLKFFEPAKGQGTWEIFAAWLYKDLRKAPGVPWEVVPGGLEAQTAVEFNSGAISVAPLRWADRKEVFALAIIDETGAVIEPTPENVAAGKYPLTRPAFIVAANKPTTNKRKVLEFLLGEKGQAIVGAGDLLPNFAAK